MENTPVLWKNIGRIASTLKVAVKINITLLCSTYIFLLIPLYLTLNDIFSITGSVVQTLDVVLALSTLALMCWVGMKIYEHTETIDFLNWSSRGDGLPKGVAACRELIQNSKNIAAEEKSRLMSAFSEQQSDLVSCYSSKAVLTTILPGLAQSAKSLLPALQNMHGTLANSKDEIQHRMEQFLSLPQNITPPVATFVFVGAASLILVVVKLLSMAV